MRGGDWKGCDGKERSTPEQAFSSSFTVLMNSWNQKAAEMKAVLDETDSEETEENKLARVAKFMEGSTAPTKSLLEQFRKSITSEGKCADEWSEEEYDYIRTEMDRLCGIFAACPESLQRAIDKDDIRMRTVPPGDDAEQAALQEAARKAEADRVAREQAARRLEKLQDEGDVVFPPAAWYWSVDEIQKFYDAESKKLRQSNDSSCVLM